MQIAAVWIVMRIILDCRADHVPEPSGKDRCRDGICFFYSRKQSEQRLLPDRLFGRGYGEYKSVTEFMNDTLEKKGIRHVGYQGKLTGVNWKYTAFET